MGKVLILAREEVVAALLGLMVEIRGFKPVFLTMSEPIEDALTQQHPHLVVIDCDHPGCTEAVLAAAQQAGAKPILFSPFRMKDEVQRVAARFGVDSFTLPTDTETFGKMLES